MRHESVLRLRLERVVLDACAVPDAAGRAALVPDLQDAIQRHLAAEADGRAPRPGLDTAAHAVAKAVRAALGPSGTRNLG